MESGTLIRNRVALALHWMLGGLFLYAGTIKALAPAQFALDIANYRLVPWPVAAGLALYLPWLEILAGGILILGPWRAGALRILLLLMLVFLQALLTAWLRGLNIHCGCFGSALATSNYALLFLRDLLILSGLGWLLGEEWKRRVAEEAVAERETRGL